jgi:hypothetical protein
MTGGSAGTAMVSRNRFELGVFFLETLLSRFRVRVLGLEKGDVSWHFPDSVSADFSLMSRPRELLRSAVDAAAGEGLEKETTVIVLGAVVGASSNDFELRVDRFRIGSG